MQDKFYKLISNLLELSDRIEERFTRIEQELEAQSLRANSANENKKTAKEKFLES